MVQSDEVGVLSFLHRTTYGAKRGLGAEANPVRRYWPHFLSSPIHGKLAPKVGVYVKASPASQNSEHPQ